MQRKSVIFLLGVLGAAALPAAALADVFKYRDAFGHIHLTDKPMRGMKLLRRFSIQTGRGVRKSTRGTDSLAKMFKRRDVLKPLIAQAAEDNRLRPALVHAVIRAESAYRADAVSSKGAVGLMQLMPATAERYGVDDRYDPAQNVRGGTAYLRDLIDMFDGDLRLAVAGYNAGENAVIKYGRQIPPYAETQQYVRKVMRFFDELTGDEQVAMR